MDWVFRSGLHTEVPRLSGLLVLPCDVGTVTLRLDNVPVTASLPFDIVLGLDWLQFIQRASHIAVVHLNSSRLHLWTLGSNLAMSAHTGVW